MCEGLARPGMLPSMPCVYRIAIASVLALLVSLSANALAESLVQPVPIVGNFVMLRLLHNPGIAWGVRLPGGIQLWAIATALLAVLWAAGRECRARTHDPASLLGFGLLIGGAVANIFDRLPDGLVTDYFSIGTFPVFNLADACICIGAGLLAIYGSRTPRCV